MHYSLALLTLLVSHALCVPMFNRYGQIPTSSQIQSTLDELNNLYLSEVNADQGQRQLPTISRGMERAEKTLDKYQFNAVNPETETTEPVSIYNGYDQEYYLGNPANIAKVQRKYAKMFPPGQELSQEQIQTKEGLERSHRVSLQAMKYLMSSTDAGIIHEKSGNIYLNPNADAEDIQKVLLKYRLGLLPKLRYGGQLHFKMSDAKKKKSRSSSRAIRMGKKLEDETSSEEDNDHQIVVEEDASSSHDSYAETNEYPQMRNRRGKGRAD